MSFNFDQNGNLFKLQCADVLTTITFNLYKQIPAARLGVRKDVAKIFDCLPNTELVWDDQ